MSWFGTYLVSGITVRYDFGTAGEKKKSTMLSFFSFILNRQYCKFLKKFHLDVKIINIICYIVILYIKSVLFS